MLDKLRALLPDSKFSQAKKELYAAILKARPLQPQLPNDDETITEIVYGHPGKNDGILHDYPNLCVIKSHGGFTLALRDDLDPTLSAETKNMLVEGRMLLTKDSDEVKKNGR